VQQRDLVLVWHFAITLLQIYSWICFERIFKIAEYLAKYGGKVDASSALAPGHCSAERWRTHL